MSDGLLDAIRLNEQYLQSPIDDLWSFYYVVQQAAVFNNVQFASSTPPARLLDLRRLIGGSQMERAHGKLTIISASLRESECGRFLMECLPILREWDSRLQQLTGDWKDIEMDGLASGDSYEAYYPHFRDFTMRGVLELTGLVQQHFPSASGLYY
jgi:hypothetical protein